MAYLEHVQEEYRKKLVSADDAVKHIKSGDVVDYGFFNGKPVAIDQALARRASELKDVSVYMAVTLPPIPEIVKFPESFIYVDWQWSKLTRMVKKGVGPAFYSPILYHEAPHLYRMFASHEDGLSPDMDGAYRSFYYNDREKRAGVTWTCVCRVSPMDKYGHFNLGPMNSESSANIDSADVVILEVNKNVPVCMGGAEESVHIDRADFIVEAPDDQMMYNAPQAPVTDVDRRIAENVIKYMRDGCCIQLGIGGIPNQVGLMIAQSDLKNLGGHTEMVVDAYMDMIKSGRMNGIKKNIDRYKVVYTFAIGSQDLYDFMDENPSFASYPVEYSNNPRIIAKNDNMVSICNAVQVDLFSQVNAESNKGNQISGNGGMWDFALGAIWSKGGKCFLCLPSTYIQPATGKLMSRIVPALPIGSITTIPRQMVDHVVTEFGVARMRGCPTWMRAEKLIEIAHPDFRDVLIREADNFGIWRRSNKK